MFAYFADAANTLIFVLKSILLGILIFHDVNNMWSCQVYFFPEISENFNLTKDLYFGQPGLFFLIKVGLHRFKS